MDQLAFLLFPVEVWEVILENTEKSKDIVSIFKAYPELEREGVLKTKRHLWLFDQVAPHVFPWLTRKERLSSRQVCRQWCQGADNNASTFICSSLRLSYRDRGPYKVIPQVEQVWAREMDMLERFGKHIWSLDLSMDHMTFRHFYESVLHTLGLVPNLKSLALKTGCHILRSQSDSEIEGLQFLNTSRLTFMPLTHLESLDITSEYTPTPIITFLMQFHETRIKRLVVRRWQFQYRNLYLNLTELRLEASINEYEDTWENREILTNILRSLNAPQLRRLYILDSCPILSDSGCEIVPLLSRFSCLECLSVGHNNVHGDDEYAEWDLISDCCELRYSKYFTPSIKYIKISLEQNTEKLNFNIFHCFPSLVSLAIYWSGRSGNEKPEMPGCFQSDQMYNMKIWEVLPDLDTITIDCFLYDKWRWVRAIPIVFSRFQYDLLQG